MALDLEGDSPSVADVDDARILLARLDQHAWSGRGELPQLRSGVLVRAVFAPHDGEDTKLFEARLTPKNHENFLVLFRGETVLGN